MKLMKSPNSVLNFAHKAVVVSLIGITLFGSAVLCDFGYKVVSRVIVHQRQLKTAAKPKEEGK